MAQVNKFTFAVASDECAAKSGDLVSIHDAAESAFVETLINEGPECPDDGSGSWTLDSQVFLTPIILNGEYDLSLSSLLPHE